LRELQAVPRSVGLQAGRRQRFGQWLVRDVGESLKPSPPSNIAWRPTGALRTVSLTKIAGI
jgi:hypothetical protein